MAGAVTPAVPFTGRKVAPSVPLPPPGVICQATELSVAAAAFCMRFLAVSVVDFRTGFGDTDAFGTRSTCWIEPVFVTW